VKPLTISVLLAIGGSAAGRAAAQAAPIRRLSGRTVADCHDSRSREEWRPITPPLVAQCLVISALLMYYLSDGIPSETHFGG
jgi:hypothetical protein